MKIKEVCERTGLTRRTVRFYEEKALFTPKKTYYNGREYREYSEADVARLQDIATLRRARFTIQEIKQMEAQPEDMPEVFTAYREGLYQQQAELEALIHAAQTVNPEELTSTRQLIDLMERATAQLPLPAMDIRPRFRYLDEQEDIYAEFRRKKTELRQKKQDQNLQIGMYTAVTSFNTYKNTNPRSLDMSNEQKLSVMQMLRDE